MGELVALESRNIDNECGKTPEEDYVDFVAATTAALGVPSPCLSRGRSFEDSSASPVDHQTTRKGDIEETAELLRVLELSKSETPSLLPVDTFNDLGASASPGATACLKSSEPPNVVEKLEVNGFDENQNSCLREESTSGNCKTLINHNIAPKSSETVIQEATLLSAKMELGNSSTQSTCEESTNLLMCKDDESRSFDALGHSSSPCNESSQHTSAENHLCVSGEDEHNQSQTASSSDVQDKENKQNGDQIIDSSNTLIPAPDSDSSKERRHYIDEPENFTGVDDGSEPIYEGEDSILGSGATANQNREPMYEGEAILAQQGEKGCIEAHDTKKDEISPREGENFNCIVMRAPPPNPVQFDFALQACFHDSC